MNLHKSPTPSRRKSFIFLYCAQAILQQLYRRSASGPHDEARRKAITAVVLLARCL
jgi:hypothetical protein